MKRSNSKSSSSKKKNSTKKVSSANDTTSSPLRVAFLHPNLGIGGAERLIVDCASALQKSGHTVHLFTNYHDPGHCYEETRDGTLGVTVYGQTQDHLFGRFRVLIAILRMIYLTIIFAFRHSANYDVVVVDQVSHAIPILSWFTSCRILFYCHFPDQLLASRNSLIKRIYRFPFDWFEEYTTGFAHLILVNSLFTLETFQKTFTRLQSMVDDGRVQVLYPSIDFARYKSITSAEGARLPPATYGEVALLNQLIYGTSLESAPQMHLLTSINRFERKKNISLAIRAYADYFKQPTGQRSTKPVRLLISGGYDPVNIENCEHYRELWNECHALGLQCVELNNITSKDGRTELTFGAESKELEEANYATPEAKFAIHTRVDLPIVYFLRSFTDLQRSFLLSHSLAILYTPSGEHFGIVPVEAMFMERPVIACASGGPKESIIDWNDPKKRASSTGFLCQPIQQEWCQAMTTLITSEDAASTTTNTKNKKSSTSSVSSSTTLSHELGVRGHAHVLAKFHFDTFQKDLIAHCQSLMESKKTKRVDSD